MLGQLLEWTSHVRAIGGHYLRWTLLRLLRPSLPMAQGDSHSLAVLKQYQSIIMDNSFPCYWSPDWEFTLFQELWQSYYQLLSIMPLLHAFKFVYSLVFLKEVNKCFLLICFFRSFRSLFETTLCLILCLLPALADTAFVFNFLGLVSSHLT